MPPTDTDARNAPRGNHHARPRTVRRSGERCSGRAGGSFEVKGGRGTVQITGKGVLVGRLGKGSLEIVDLSPNDQWSPRVNGIPRGKTVTLRGKNVSFYVPGGRYKITAHGSDISISARGTGAVILDGDPDAVGDTGMYAVGDGDLVPLPEVQTKATFGRNEVIAPSPQSFKIPAMTTPQTILIVEDETSIASFVALYLKNAGYVVKAVGTGGAALNAIAAEQPALIILDLNLPDMDGLEICRRVRKSSDVPILMLTARDEDVDKIIGLEVGADDYLTKPFNPRELVARVKSVLRRSSPDRRRDEGDEIRHGDLVINAGRREAMVGDREIQLAPKEFDLLWELLDHRGLVLTRDQLLERVWGYTFAGDTRTVDVHVRQIRRKLEDASPIVTVWGVGYKVAPDRSTTAPAALDLHFERARVAAIPPAGLVPARDRARRRRRSADLAAALPDVHPQPVDPGAPARGLRALPALRRCRPAGRRRGLGRDRLRRLQARARDGRPDLLRRRLALPR